MIVMNQPTAVLLYKIVEDDATVLLCTYQIPESGICAFSLYTNGVLDSKGQTLVIPLPL